MSEGNLDKIREELEEINDHTTQKRRSFLNPLYWMGVCTYILGLILCATIIGIPLGIPTIITGKSMMYKNYKKKAGLI